MTVIIIILLITFGLFIYNKSSSITLSGGVPGNWNNDIVMNNLYMFLLYDEASKQYIVYSKFGFGSDSEENMKESYYDEFIAHMKYLSEDSKYSIFKQEVQKLKIVFYAVYDISKINIDNFDPYLTINEIKDPDDFYNYITNVLNQYGLNRNNIWNKSISTNAVNNSNSFSKFLTALHESFGHLACADVFKNNGLENISFLTDDTYDNNFQLINSYVDGVYSPFSWAFSNSNEFVRGTIKEIEEPKTFILKMMDEVVNQSVANLTAFSKCFFMKLTNRPIEVINNFIAYGIIKISEVKTCDFKSEFDYDMKNKITSWHKSRLDGKRDNDDYVKKQTIKRKYNKFATPRYSKGVYECCDENITIGSVWKLIKSSIGVRLNYSLNEREFISHLMNNYETNYIIIDETQKTINILNL